MSSHQFLFYSEDATSLSGDITLEGEEHHHLAHVLRCQVGDGLYVTNGRGLILECRVRRVVATSTVVETLSVYEDREPGPSLVLALATLKKEKFEQALEQCVELGITRCVPFVAQRSHCKTYPTRFLTRLRKIALAAIKQSFRSFLPEIDDPVAFDEMLLMGKSVSRVVVGGQGDPPVQPRPRGESVLAVVGPESGFTDQERAALADAGATFASVSSHRLRSETAAVALVSALSRRN